jgi:hypothetical protein
MFRRNGAFHFRFGRVWFTDLKLRNVVYRFRYASLLFSTVASGPPSIFIELRVSRILPALQFAI